MGRLYLCVIINMLRKSDRQKNKSKIYKQYEIIAMKDADEVSYWFSAQSKEHAAELFNSFLEKKNINASIIEILGDD